MRTLVLNNKEGRKSASFIMSIYNMFVYCFFTLNEECCALIRVLEASLLEAPVSTFELDIAKHAYVPNSIEKLK